MNWLRNEAPTSLIIGLAITLTWLALAIFAPLLTPFDPIKIDAANALLSPSAEHLLGTDSVGRDLLTQRRQSGHR